MKKPDKYREELYVVYDEDLNMRMIERIKEGNVDTFIHYYAYSEEKKIRLIDNKNNDKITIEIGDRVLRLDICDLANLYTMCGLLDLISQQEDKVRAWEPITITKVIGLL